MSTLDYQINQSGLRLRTCAEGSYELGLAHALAKPVVLISSNQEDVPFDLQHIRVIYYDMRDPFWGERLIAKVSENIVSALKNPGEALLKRVVGGN